MDKFIVPEDLPSLPYNHKSRSEGVDWKAVSDVLEGKFPVDPFSVSPIANMFFWDRHPINEGRFNYWSQLSAKCFEPGFVLPEEARSYLNWLVKGEVKDTFDED